MPESVTTIVDENKLISYPLVSGIMVGHAFAS
jgi:hypothetical protein